MENNNQYNNQYYQPTNQPNGYQQPYQQPIYQQPPMPQYDSTKEVMSIGSYIGMFILSALPIVNLICWIVWLASPNTNKNKKNFIWAQIIMIAISYAIVILSAIVITVSGISLLDNYAMIGLLL